MGTLFQSTITAIGPEVQELLEGGVLILFRDGAPSELAEVSVLHKEMTPGTDTDIPKAGDVVTIGALAIPISSVGETAWRKVVDMGHVVLNFNGSSATDRPGEICLESREARDIAAVVAEGTVITIQSAL